MDHVAVTRRTALQDGAIAARILGNALSTLADEMATTVFRTAHSAVVRDAMDFSAALCAPSGETIAQAVTIPLQLGSIPNAMRTLLDAPFGKLLLTVVALGLAAFGIFSFCRARFPERT